MVHLCFHLSKRIKWMLILTVKLNKDTNYLRLFHKRTYNKLSQNLLIWAPMENIEIFGASTRQDILTLLLPIYKMLDHNCFILALTTRNMKLRLHLYLPVITKDVSRWKKIHAIKNIINKELFSLLIYILLEQSIQVGL